MDAQAARDYFYRREARRREAREAERLEWLKRVKAAVARYAPRYPEIQRVYLFGSILQPGRFRPNSDIDMAVACNNLEIEGVFWQTLERCLRRDVDMRPLTHPITETVKTSGEQVYEREGIGLIEQHSA